MAMINKHGTFALVELHNQVSSATFDTTYIPILHNCNVFPDQQRNRYTHRHKREQEDKKKPVTFASVPQPSQAAETTGNN
jgi:hypothetical protein